MLEVADPQVLAVLRPFFISAYLLWGALWVLVAVHYGAAAHFSWREQGGRWSAVLRDTTAPVMWAFRQLLRDVGLRAPEPTPPTVPHRYTPGHILRFAVFLGSLTPAMFGFYFWQLDRSRWATLDVYVNLLMVALSVFAAMGHLFLAYRAVPKRWKALVVCTAAWLAIAPGVVYAVGI